MANNAALGYRALHSNTTGSYNTAIGYNAGYRQEFIDPHTQLLNAITHIDKMLQTNNVLSIGNEIPAVADAYTEFKEAIDKFKLVATLTKPNK